MDSQTVKNVITNLRDPLHAREKIQFTSRSILFLTQIFHGKRIDVIDLHCLLLKIAHSTGCFQEEKYISLRDLVVTLYSFPPPCISGDDILLIANTFSADNDSDFKEVEDMKILVESLRS